MQKGSFDSELTNQPGIGTVIELGVVSINYFPQRNNVFRLPILVYFLWNSSSNLLDHSRTLCYKSQIATLMFFAP